MQSISKKFFVLFFKKNKVFFILSIGIAENP